MLITEWRWKAPRQHEDLTLDRQKKENCFSNPKMASAMASIGLSKFLAQKRALKCIPSISNWHIQRYLGESSHKKGMMIIATRQKPLYSCRKTIERRELFVLQTFDLRKRLWMKSLVCFYKSMLWREEITWFVRGSLHYSSLVLTFNFVMTHI